MAQKRMGCNFGPQGGELPILHCLDIRLGGRNRKEALSERARPLTTRKNCPDKTAKGGAILERATLSPAKVDLPSDPA